MKLDNLILALILIVGFYVIFYIGKVVHDLIHRSYNLNTELVENDNAALALAISGYYLGLVIAIGGTLVGPSQGIVNDLLDLAFYGIISIALLNISWVICDKIILYKFHVNDELIRDHNQGTGAVVAATSIASGFIIYGAVSGEGGSIWTTLIFWAIGQIVLILAAMVYRLITPYDDHEEIEKDNVAAGVSFAGALIAIGIIVGLAGEGDFTTWREALPSYIGFAVVGLILLPVIRTLTDKVLLPTVKLSDEIANQEKPNVGAAYIEAFSYIAAAFIVYWCV